MARYSNTPLVKKLGIKEGFKLYVKNPPENYMQLVAPLPLGIAFSKRLSRNLDMIHVFTKDKTELMSLIKKFLESIKQDGMIWISWPKKISKVKTDVTEDIIREIILPLGLVDVKVCAVDDIWSGLKLVIRASNRR